MAGIRGRLGMSGEAGMAAGKRLAVCMGMAGVEMWGSRKSRGLRALCRRQLGGDGYLPP